MGTAPAATHCMWPAWPRYRRNHHLIQFGLSCPSCAYSVQRSPNAERVSPDPGSGPGGATKLSTKLRAAVGGGQRGCDVPLCTTLYRIETRCTENRLKGTHKSVHNTSQGCKARHQARASIHVQAHGRREAGDLLVGASSRLYPLYQIYMICILGVYMYPYVLSSYLLIN